MMHRSITRIRAREERYEGECGVKGVVGLDKDSCAVFSRFRRNAEICKQCGSPYKRVRQLPQETPLPSPRILPEPPTQQGNAPEPAKMDRVKTPDIQGVEFLELHNTVRQYREAVVKVSAVKIAKRLRKSPSFISLIVKLPVLDEEMKSLIVEYDFGLGPLQILLRFPKDLRAPLVRAYCGGTISAKALRQVLYWLPEGTCSLRLLLESKGFTWPAGLKDDGTRTDA